MTDESPGEALVPTFIPPLIALLAKAEIDRGRPLAEEEVLAIRDEAAVMMLPLDAAESIAASRGYDDIDPEDAWGQWQAFRTEKTADGD